MKQFKRDEVPANNFNLSIDNFQLFKYRRPLVEKTEKHNTTKGESYVENTKIVVPLKYLNNFWRSLDMPLVNCKVHLQLNWI